MVDQPNTPQRPQTLQRSQGALDRAVVRQTKKADQARREGGGSVAQYLGMMGALGWVLVTPPLLFGFLGRWLDRAFDTGFGVTALMVLVGIGLGGWLGWKRMRAEAGLEPPKSRTGT